MNLNPTIMDWDVTGGKKGVERNLAALHQAMSKYYHSGQMDKLGSAREKHLFYDHYKH